MSRTSAS
ncbi:hypothetical protein F383_21370 [Gossypium arboreum]|nr:hypothetical protein F383_21370 [Gossypium arboreum]